jgi:hypothetical protein
MLKKGFCKDILTKQAYSGQEKLTGAGQETLTKLEEILDHLALETLMKKV